MPGPMPLPPPDSGTPGGGPLNREPPNTVPGGGGSGSGTPPNNQCPQDKPYFLYGKCTSNPNGIECDDSPAGMKTINCPDYQRWCDMSTGTWKCDPSAKGGSSGGGGGGGTVGNLNLTPYLTPNKDIMDLYAKRTPEELNALNQVSGLARLLSGMGGSLYNVGMPAYTAAMQYYQSILSGDKAAATSAIAPEAGQLTELFSGARKGIENSGLRGGARETAIAESGRQATGAIANLLPQARQNAAAAGGAGGLSGASLGISTLGGAAGLQGGLAEAEKSNRNTAAQLEQANRFGGAGLLLTNKGLDIQKALGFASLDLQKELGFASLDVQKSGLSQAASQFQQSFGLQQQYLQMAQQQMKQQQQQQEGAKWGGLLGNVLQGGAMVGSAALTGGATMMLLPMLLPLICGRLG